MLFQLCTVALTPPESSASISFMSCSATLSPCGSAGFVLPLFRDERGGAPTKAVLAEDQLTM
jgi:hypothetical protein